MNTNLNSKNKRKHLDYIQGCITRMSNKADMIKKFHLFAMSILLYMAAFPNKYSFEGKSITAGAITMTIISLVCMYFDAYFLELERMFVKKYNEIRVLSEDKIDYNINIYEIKPQMKFSKTLFSVTVFWWYLLILISFCCCLCLR